MISKEKFAEYINYVKELRVKEDKFNEGLSLCFGEENVDTIFVFSNVETQIVKMLCDLMEIEYNPNDLFGDDIQYFIYELDFGKSGKDCIKDGNKTYSLSTPEELYDYILLNSKEKENNGKKL